MYLLFVEVFCFPDIMWLPNISTRNKELDRNTFKTKFCDVLEKFCSDHQATIIVQGGGEEQQYGIDDFFRKNVFIDYGKMK